MTLAPHATAQALRNIALGLEPEAAAELTEAAALIEAHAGAEQDARDAIQALIDTVQHFDGQVAPDWSSYRVSFGYGVCRGVGDTPGQQIVSAVRQCLALRVPPAFSVRPRDPQ